MIKEGYKVALRKDSRFIGLHGNPDAGAVGVVVDVNEWGWITVKWLHGKIEGAPLEDGLTNSYDEKDLKVIP